METIKVIDLLNKIAKGEEVPNKIKSCDICYKYEKIASDYKEINTSCFWWFFKGEVFGSNGNKLNNEVEIIEEDKKIEEIKMCTSGIMGFDGVENITSELKNKINELVIAVNKLKGVKK